MAYKIKKRIPKREDPEYEEIEAFEDFELINNAFYEMGIRAEYFKELTKKFVYCEKLSEQIYKLINWKNSCKVAKHKNNKENEDSIFIIEKKTPKESFQNAFKQLENNNLKQYDEILYELLKLDFQSFKNEIVVSSFENKTNEELIQQYSYIETFLDMIPKIIAEDFYIDFYSYYYDEDTKVQKDIEYEESSATSLYIKREYKKNYYVETIIDSDNNKITRTLYPLSKRKLLIDHIPKFSTNHLIIYKQATQFLEDFFKTNQVKMKKQVALADAFFCYDYYHYRIEEVLKKNQNHQKLNSENVVLQDAIQSIESIDNNTYLSYPQKKEEKAPYIEIIIHEELKKIDNPTLNKTSKSYIFDESKFTKSGINRSTALKYYQWIQVYIDDSEYINIINTAQPL
jgi:hypothetical protein